METKDYSYGIIPIKKDEGDFRFLMIKHLRGGHWGFPKGHKEAGETDLEAALRELKEETGAKEVDLLSTKLIKESYKFNKNRQEVTKNVIYFLAIVRDKNLILQKEEIKELRWVSYEEALNLATFEETKNLVTQAHLMAQDLFY
jgi:8-oxo-dGTP pyrophosphatase MutT (NUDIX family)